MRTIRLLIGLVTAAVVITVAPMSWAEASGVHARPVSSTGSQLATAQPAPIVTATPGSPGVFATEVRWTRRTVRLTYGGTSLLEGQVVTDHLVAEDGALPDVPVRLYARAAGGSQWRHVATSYTSSDRGVFRFTHKPSRTTDYRARFAGDLLYAPSEATAKVSVARRVTAALARNSDGTYTMSGSVAPSYPGRTVKLQRKTCSSCSWSTIKTATTSSSSTYRFRVMPPSTKGTWYYRVSTPSDRSFITSYSPTWAISRS